MKKQTALSLAMLLPWILISPALVFMEIKKLHLNRTILLDRHDRQSFYLKLAMPGLEDDYFKLLKTANLHMKNERLKYGIFVDDSLTDYVRLMVRNYTIFGLSPARPTTKNEEMSFKLFYRTGPSGSYEKIVATIQGHKPSYIVRCKL